MRTTLTIDDDLAGLLQRRARESGKPFREVVNSALRRGLTEAGPAVETPRVTVRVHDFGEFLGGVDTGRYSQFQDELDAGDLARKFNDPA